MQWRKTDHANTPMGSFDKFEIGESYLLDLRIGFEGGEEKGHVYPKNWKDFKVNGKSVNAWLDNMDFTDGHVWHVYESYKLVDPSTVGSLAGTVNSFGSGHRHGDGTAFQERLLCGGVYHHRHGKYRTLHSFRHYPRHLHHEGVEERPYKCRV